MSWGRFGPCDCNINIYFTLHLTFASLCRYRWSSCTHIDYTTIVLFGPSRAFSRSQTNQICRNTQQEYAICSIIQSKHFQTVSKWQFELGRRAHTLAPVDCLIEKQVGKSPSTDPIGP
ncbi:hypothetical protein FKM82_003432 [Ascaphus truei]